MQTTVWPAPYAKEKLDVPVTIESSDAPIRAANVSEHALGLSTQSRAHSREIGETENTHSGPDADSAPDSVKRRQ